MSLGVKLEAALIALGLDPKATDFDHTPPIAMRPIDEATGDTIPPQLDPRYIVPRSRAGHRAKTFGDHVPLSGDVQRIAKMKRAADAESAFRERLLAKDAGEPAPPKPGRAWQSRPFPKKQKDRR